jgi:hypothetical protein
VIGDAAGRIAWWLCRPSIGRALLCGAAAMYLGTFIGADAVTMFCAAQGARLLVRAFARRPVRDRALLPPRSRDRLTLEPIRSDLDPGFAIGQSGPEASHARVPASDADPGLTLDELIAGDPGPEPGDPRAELDESIDVAPTATARIVSSADAPRLAASANEAMRVAGTDAAQELRIAVAETS